MRPAVRAPDRHRLIHQITQGEPTPLRRVVPTLPHDLETIIHKNHRQDPTAAAGVFYEVFTFDTFRVRNGKLVEHWDGAVINPPAPAAPGRGAGGQ